MSRGFYFAWSMPHFAISPIRIGHGSSELTVIADLATTLTSTGDDPLEDRPGPAQPTLTGRRSCVRTQ
jgi:hypothetical protein